MRQFEERIETIDASTGPLNATRSADYGCWIYVGRTETN
jgi:hypothetical protein